MVDDGSKEDICPQRDTWSSGSGYWNSSFLIEPEKIYNLLAHNVTWAGSLVTGLTTHVFLLIP